MKILGLDLGGKNIGVAISDDLTLTAQVLTSIKRTFPEKDLVEILALAKEYQVREIVVGMQIKMDGTKGKSALEVEEFIEKLHETLLIRIIPWDERFSNVTAERILLEGDLSQKKRQKVIVRLSAAIILQGYLNSRRRGNGPAS